MLPFLKVTNQQPGGRLTTLNQVLPSWKGQHLVLTGVDAHPDCGFAFPACDASAETTISELTECLIHHHVIPHMVARGILTKELTSQQKCDSGPTVMESSSLTL